MRIRVIEPALQTLAKSRKCVRFIRVFFYAVQLISHKVFRYTVPLFLFQTLASWQFSLFQMYFSTLFRNPKWHFYFMAYAAAYRRRKKLSVYQFHYILFGKLGFGCRFFRF